MKISEVNFVVFGIILLALTFYMFGQLVWNIWATEGVDSPVPKVWEEIDFEGENREMAQYSVNYGELD